MCGRTILRNYLVLPHTYIQIYVYVFSFLVEKYEYKCDVKQNTTNRNWKMLNARLTRVASPFQVRLEITRQPEYSAGKIQRVFHRAHLPNLPREPSIRRDHPAEVAIQHRRTKHGMFGLRDGAGWKGWREAFATEPTAVFPR